MVTIRRTRSRERVPQFLLWALVGAAECLGLVSAMTIGVFVLSELVLGCQSNRSSESAKALLKVL
jgi:hypothetical protein